MGKQVYYNEFEVMGELAHMYIKRLDNDEIIANVLIDAKFVDLVRPYSWRLNQKGYVITSIKKRKTRIHNLILDRDTSDPKIVCDHINRNKHDNRLCNLRIVSQKENCMNIVRNDYVSQDLDGNILKSNTGTESIYNYYDKTRDEYRVYFLKNRKLLALGRYKTKQEAEIAVKVSRNLIKRLDYFIKRNELQ